MSHDATGRWPAGQTALLARIEPAEPVVEAWRRRLDPSAAAGVPAHVTVLFPFLHIDRLNPATVEDLRELIEEHAPFTVRFARCGRFPAVLYLEPTPAEPFRALTAPVAARWPEAQPYGGQFAEVIPHLTVADGHPAHILDEVESLVVPHLPVIAEVAAVSLFVSDGGHWREHDEFRLGG
jgi:2'-5' RNA ligase